MLRTSLAIAVVWLFVSTPASAVGPEPVLLWPEGAPGAQGTETADCPSIRIYPAEPSIATGAAVVVCPGGGYGILAYDHEGHQVAKWFNRIGVTGIVLQYRLGPKYHHPAPLNDAQRAIRYLRAHAAEMGVDKNRIGVMGFSAGGHLASTVSTHYDRGAADAVDPIERESCRPDFAVLCYPVISIKSEFGHKGSLRNLLGDDPAPELVESLSNETQVTADTPPTFIFHTAEDPGVPVQNALVYYDALVRNRVKSELHVYQDGPHGVGLAQGDPTLATWTDRLHDWLRGNGFLSATARTGVKGTIQLNGQPLRWGMVALVPEANSEESSPLPVGFGLVSNGNFEIPASRGAAVGRNRLQVLDFGNVVAHPTLEDARFLTGEARNSSLVVEVVEGENTLAFELQAAE
jgi:acetyl esterase/lipase